MNVNVRLFQKSALGKPFAQNRPGDSVGRPAALLHHVAQMTREFQRAFFGLGVQTTPQRRFDKQRRAA